MKSSTLLVSKFFILRLVNLDKPSNIWEQYLKLLVLKLETSKDVKVYIPLNILFISVTEFVSKFDKSKVLRK